MTADREVLRAASTAAVNSCRWCGIEPREHARRWSSSVGWHTWESPQDSLRKKRLLDLRRERRRADG